MKPLYGLTILVVLFSISTQASAKEPTALQKIGGIVVESMAGRPEVVILDMQKSKSESKVASEVAASMQVMFRIPVREIENAPATAGQDPLAVAASLATQTNRVAAIVLCEDVKLPSLLIAPEGRWAVVNIAPLKADAPSPKVLEARVRKEIWRAASFAMGAANSAFPLCLMKPVFKPTDLDALPVSMISAEPLSGIRQQFKAQGVVPVRQSSYRKACEEGWAPPPTNDIQRAIWEKAAKPK